MGIFSPYTFDESSGRPCYKRPPKFDAEKRGGVITAGYFTIPLTLIDTIAALGYTASTVTHLLLLMSMFSYYKSGFTVSDQGIATTLNMSNKTIQRSKKGLALVGLRVQEEGITPGGPKYGRIHYKELEFPGFSNGKAKSAYFTIERSTFAFLIEALRNGSINPRHIKAYLAMRYFEWCARRDRGDWKKGREAHPDAHHTDFTIDKDKSRALFGMEDTPKLIKELSQIPAADGGPLFRVIDKYQSLRILGLRDAPQTESPISGVSGQNTIH